MSEPSASRLERYVRLDRVNRPYLEWQLSLFLPYLGQRVLEIGCGVGGVIELLGRRELVHGIDVEAEVLEHAERRFADRPECRFTRADVGALPPRLLSELREERLDTVVAINVLEHVRDDIGALQSLGSVLVPGGVLALLVPAHPGLYGAYDRLDGHYRRYTKRQLRTALLHTPFRPVRLRYFNAVGALGWWVQYRLLRRSTLVDERMGAMNRILPWVRPLEARIPPPFGLSLVAVCRREEGASAGAEA